MLIMHYQDFIYAGTTTTTIFHAQVKLLILSHVEKSIYFMMNEIRVNLSQEKTNFINDTYQKELQYWKKVALKKALTENETKELIDLAPSRAFLVRNLQ